MINENKQIEMQEVIKGIRSGSLHLEREGLYWSAADIEKLKRLFSEGVGITNTALELERTESAVYQQIEKLKLFKRGTYRKQSGPSDESEGKCRCSECTCNSAACPRYAKDCPIGTMQQV